MNKLSLFLTSLVAAIPGGILAALMVMAIVHKPGFNEMPTAFTVLASIVLAVSAFVTVLPLGILIFGPRRPEPEEESEEELAAVGAADQEAEFGAESVDAGGFGDEFDDEFATAEIDASDDEFADEEFEDWEEGKKK